MMRNPREWYNMPIKVSKQTAVVKVIYAGAMTMAGKLIRASIVSILGFTLAAFGFKEGASVQPESACNAIIGVMLFGCCGLALLGIICSVKMKLTQETHKVVIAELDRIHNGGKNVRCRSRGEKDAGGADRSSI